MEQLAEDLEYYLQTLAQGLPLPDSQLNKLLPHLVKTPDTTKYITLLKLLQIHQRHLTHTGEYTHIYRLNLLSELLTASAGSLGVKTPLKYLLQGDPNLFLQYCLKSKDEEYIQLARKMNGLFPWISIGKQHHRPFIANYQQNQSKKAGNPNWLLSRIVLQTWFDQKRSKLRNQTQQIYLFLLSSQQLKSLWCLDPVKLYWLQIYHIYVQLLLSHNLERNNSQITWNNTDPAIILGNFINIEPTLYAQSKMIYYLVTGLIKCSIGFDQQVNSDFDQFKAAFSIFQTLYKHQSDWQYLLLLNIFSQIAKTKNLPQIVTYIHNTILNLSKTSEISQLLPFIQYTLTLEQCYEIFEQNQIDIWSLSMRKQFKEGIVAVYIECENYQDALLDYISDDLLVGGFIKSKKMKDGNKLEGILRFVQRNFGIFVCKIMKISGLNQSKAKRSLELFVSIWKTYKQIIQKQNQSIQCIQKILTTDHSILSKGCQQLFALPRDDPSIVNNLLLLYADQLRNILQKTNNKQEINTKIAQFVEKHLQELVGRLQQSQKDQFWRRWAYVLKKDNKFVEDVLNIEYEVQISQ